MNTPTEVSVINQGGFLASVVQFLLHRLQSEVSRAESSLLQAAASFPLYGRAHCITAVLQRLDTK